MRQVRQPVQGHYEHCPHNRCEAVVVCRLQTQNENTIPLDHTCDAYWEGVSRCRPHSLSLGQGPLLPNIAPLPLWLRPLGMTFPPFFLRFRLGSLSSSSQCL